MNNSHNGFGEENSTSPNEGTEQTVFPIYQVEQMIVRLFTPILLAVGTFGNIATICIMRRIKDHNSSQHVFLMTLAVSDFSLIQTGMLRRLFWYYFYIDIRLSHSLVCKLYNWLLYVTSMQSAWLVTCVTVQRAMSITWPHKMRVVCTLRRTYIVIAFVVLTTFLVNGHLLVGMELTSDSGCDVGTVWYKHFFAEWAWIVMFLSSFIPTLCQIMANVVLCFALFKSASTISTAGQATLDTNADHDLKSRKKTASDITKLCLALSSIFMILTLPICIQIVYEHFVYMNWTPREQAKYRLSKSVFSIMWYSNSAVNFFLYCITGTKFRKEFLNLVCCRSQNQSSASVGDATAKAM